MRRVRERGVRSFGKGRMGTGGRDPHLSPDGPDLAGEPRGERAVKEKKKGAPMHTNTQAM